MLAARSIDAETATRALQSTPGDEVERALAVWRGRFDKPAADLRERSRQFRFLAGRGFDGPTIECVMRQAAADDGSPDDDPGAA